MNHKIYESIVTTRNGDGTPHIAPMGVWQQGGYYVLAPFKPSRTLTNLHSSANVVINFTDQVQVFAGCMTGRYNWPVIAATIIEGYVLEGALTHIELEVDHIVAHERRPEVHCKVVHQATHRAFNGFNRAQSAVLELAILVSRLSMLPADKVTAEVAYLSIAIEKTAGTEEREAWHWLLEKLDRVERGKEDQAGPEPA